METAMLVEHLKQAERHVLTGAFLIARQRELISELEQRGSGDLASRGAELLALFEEIQAMHVADLLRLQTKLAET
jgi:hypothetical protein